MSDKISILLQSYGDGRIPTLSNISDYFNVSERTIVRVLREEFSLSQEADKATIKITSDPSYKLWVNDNFVGDDETLGTVEAYDILPYLKNGVNKIIVEVPEQNGLLAEVEIQTGNETHRLCTNNQLVKFTPWGDHSAEITKYLKQGKNMVSIVVSNLMANEAYWDISDEMADESYSRWWN